MTIATMVKQVTIKTDGDVFHELFKEKPHHICEMSPGYITNVHVGDGEWGVVGSVIVWNFVLDGKPKVSKAVIKSIDKEKKSVCYEVVEGDLLKDFKTISFTIHVDEIGEEKMVTWTVHYEKANENVDDPNSLLDFCVGVINDIDNHHLSKSN